MIHVYVDMVPGKNPNCLMLTCTLASSPIEFETPQDYKFKVALKDLKTRLGLILVEVTMTGAYSDKPFSTITRDLEYQIHFR